VGVGLCAAIGIRLVSVSSAQVRVHVLVFHRPLMVFLRVHDAVRLPYIRHILIRCCTVAAASVAQTGARFVLLGPLRPTRS
jgi:hypothetical protein